MISSIVIIFSFAMIVLSYKDSIDKVRILLLCFLFYLYDVFLVYIIIPNFNKIFCALIVLIVYFSLIKIIYNKKANVLDILYIGYLYMIHEVLIYISRSKILVCVLSIVIAIICILFRKKIRLLNHTLIKIWNGNNDKSLRLRCIMIITFNIAFFIILSVKN